MEKYVEKCPRCGGEVMEKEVTEVLYGGVNTAILHVAAGVCLVCGERLYAPEMVRKFEEIELKLEQQNTSEFMPLGRSYRAV
ncbi:MAG: YgiT-type zinc finger protein [Candidatus Omnitrophota bacterium]